MKMKWYEAPTDEIFEEVRQKAMKLWEVVDVDNRGRVILSPRKKTDGGIKRDEATKRWEKRHPHAKEAKRSVGS